MSRRAPVRNRAMTPGVRAQLEISALAVSAVVLLLFMLIAIARFVS